jgi:hypothetical protein
MEPRGQNWENKASLDLIESHKAGMSGEGEKSGSHGAAAEH